MGRCEVSPDRDRHGDISRLRLSQAILVVESVLGERR